MAGIRPDKFVLHCPSELSDAHWQKKKGKVGKMVKTGVGAELKKLTSMLKKVDAQTLDPAAIPSKTMDQLRDRVAGAKKEYMSKVVPIKKQCLAIRAMATKAEAKLKKVPFGKDAAKAAAAVAKAADWYSVTCKSLDLDGSIEKVKSDIVRKNAAAAKHLNTSLTKYMTGAKKFLSDPTKDSWGSNIKQQGRSVSNSVKQLSQYNARFWGEFEKFKGFDLPTLGISDDENFVKKTTALVKAAGKQVVAISKFKP